MTHVVKRRGHKQEFDERKVYASVYAACLAANLTKEEAEEVANFVTGRIQSWIKEKEGITSDQIFKQASEELMSKNKDAAFIYTTHRDIS